MSRLLLLLPLIVIAARMQVEWLWFQQFNWDAVLLRRWLLQLLFAAMASIPVMVCLIWSAAFKRSDIASPETRPLTGWRFTLLLLITAIALVISAVLSVDLAVLALRQPFELIHWRQQLLLQPFGQSPVISLAAVGLSISAMLHPRWRRWLSWGVSLALVLVVARSWGLWMVAFLIQDDGLVEPILRTDVSFALGRFGALRFALDLLLIGTVFTFSYGLWGRLARRQRLSDWSSPGFNSTARRLIGIWLSIVLAALAGLVWLSRHQLLWTQHGLVAGAGWLQHHLTLPVRSAVCLLLLLCSASCLIRTSQRVRRWLITGVAGVVLLNLAVTPFSRWLIVRPQELALESPYLEAAIRSTRHGFQLDRIIRRSVTPEALLSPADLKSGASTLSNVRLWDSGPLLESNRQLQQLRVYYRFSNAAVDRYPLNPSSDTSQQVILSARELDQSALPKRSRTWQNSHFVFTHGYGFTVSPVNTRRPDGLPSYVISDLGSETRIEGNNELGIDRAEVKQAIPVGDAALYFGMLPSPYAVAPTQVNEFDYPEGDLNVYTHYTGSAGVPIGSFINRLSAAIYLLEPRLLTTSAIDHDSRLIIRREVRQRVSAVAPFVEFRGDPYLVSVPEESKSKAQKRVQHQYWIVEGFTSSTTYPYSAAVAKSDQIRYLRNSVKAVVDAYNGSIKLYVSESDDPLIQSWNKLFPELFMSMEKMPVVLRDHLRVPEDFFKVQVSQLRRYHVEDPRIFYSGDDVWQVPLEIYGNKQISVEPYHITAQVQGNNNAEFLLLQPLTPLARPNLTAWLAARNDGEHYGELQLIDFPKDKPVLGPEQVQALINQDPDVSKVFSLWDGGGSELIQGNLLVLPVGRSLLYVEPVYLRASKGGLPSLARIVVSDGRSIAMDNNLRDALSELVKKPPPTLLPAGT